MGELVREFHKPARVTPYSRDKEEEEEREESTTKVLVESNPCYWYGLQLEGPNQYPGC